MSDDNLSSAAISLAAALSKGPPPPGNLAVPLFKHGSLQVELYAPIGRDLQQPHNRDEVYFVAKGFGTFFDGVEKHRVEMGAVLFVAAGRAHHFEDFSDDFTLVVVFYGPLGGERR